MSAIVDLNKFTICFIRTHWFQNYEIFTIEILARNNIIVCWSTCVPPNSITFKQSWVEMDVFNKLRVQSLIICSTNGFRDSGFVHLNTCIKHIGVNASGKKRN